MFHRIKVFIKKNFISSKYKIEEVKILFNVFNKKYLKKALVSYIIQPFVLGVEGGHTNSLECYTACKILDELGYVVDVVDYDFAIPNSEYNKYSIIYGFGFSLENSFSIDYENKIKKIVYGTGCDTVFCNKASFDRVKDFFYRTKKLCVSSARFAELSWRKQIIFSDLIIALGNDFVKGTYIQQTDAKVESINLFFKNVPALNISKKNYSSAKNKFLWWGSAGAIHKGLDLLIESFSQINYAELYICGYTPEYPFNEYFEENISKHDNIYNMGFVKIGSTSYHELMNKCASVIFPSVSEGGAAGIIQLACAAGIIPIIPVNVGIDIPFPELMIKEFNVHSIINCISTFLGYEDSKVEEMSSKLQEDMVVKHSYDQYFYRLKHLIGTV